MTVEDLIHGLQQFDRDAEVMLACQPRWPFEYTVRDVVQFEKADVEGRDDDAEPGEPGYTGVYGDDDEGEMVVYLVQGTQTRYLPDFVAEELKGCGFE